MPSSILDRIFLWEVLMVARIVQLLGMISAEEPNRQRIIHDAVEYDLYADYGNSRWSAKEGDVQYGDPELHHSIGVLLAAGTNPSHPHPLSTPIFAPSPHFSFK